MPAKDIFHDTVKRALEKEGWTITHDPLPVASGDVGMGSTSPLKVTKNLTLLGNRQ